MTCDDACTQTLREIGGEGDPDAETRRHLADCAPCADYRREAERVWQLSAQGIESCPRRQNIFDAGKKRRSPSPIAAAAAALLAATTLLAWAFWPVGDGRVARQDPDANAEEMLRKDPELRKQVLRAAVQEKERLAKFEKQLRDAEAYSNELSPLLAEGKTQEAADRAEAILATFPHLKLVILDPAEPQFRSSLLKFRIREFALTAQLKLLSEQPEPGDDVGKAERTQVQTRLANTLRDVKRLQEELKARGPQPRKEATVQLGGADPTLRNETLDKLRSIRLTLDVTDQPLQDLVSNFRELTRLNIIVEGGKEARETKVTIKLEDAIFEGILDHVTKQAGCSWEVDRFGTLLFKAPKK